MDGAVIGLAFGIAFGRIGDLIIGDHLGKPTSWLLAFQYEGATGRGRLRGGPLRRLEGGQVPTITHQVARLTAPSGRLLAEGVGVHQTALYDMFFATCLFLVRAARGRPGAWGCSRSCSARSTGRHESSRTSRASTSGCSA